MRYSLRQLEYFIAAGETGSIALAAERIAISPPSISTAIAHLERELAVQLFVRHHAQGLSLTRAGRILLSEAKALIEQAEGLYAAASETADQPRGELALGCLVTLAPMVLPELMSSFAAAHPHARIRPVENHQEFLLEGLRRAELDAAITYDLQIPTGVEFLSLATLPPHVVVAETHKLAGRDAVRPDELVAEPMILLDLPISREYFLSLFLAEGLQPTIAQRSAHQDTVRAMVAGGFGYTLANVRPRAEHALNGKRCVRVPLAGTPRPMTLGLATLAQLRRSRLVEAFREHCRAVVTDAAIPGMAPA
ncbi:MAG TPA: LysR family transcriptional regulator [Stellaceae bacterium]|nr:LysR family transcriptional regulator [Stellaceae bacterium]